MTLLGRLAVLLVLAAGFFTMHGFMAVSASADARTGHATHHAVQLEQPASTPTGMHAKGAAEPSSGLPAQPQVPGHHDLVAGCVVALVGIAALAAAALRPPGPGSGPSRWLLPSPATIRPWLGDRLPTLPPPRLALCVIRV